MPRILFVKRYHYTRFGGGAEEQSWLLATEFARRGWDAHYVSEMNVLPEPNIQEGVTLHGLPENPPYVSGNRLPLHQLMQQLQPDVVYVRSFDNYARDAINEAPPNTVTIWASAVTGDGLIWPRLLQMRQLTSLPLYLKRLPIHFSIFAAAKRAVRKASAVFVQRPDQLEEFLARGLKAKLIRNVQPSVPESAVQRHEGKPVILWAGSLKSSKRPESFIELARRCRDLAADFVMIGGIQEPQYEEIMACALRELPNLRWDGLIPFSRVREYYAQAHVFVSTSRQESYPNTFIHAWLHGVPVLSLDVDPEELLSKQGFGVLARTMGELEQAARELIADPDRRRRIGNLGRTYARQEHDLTSTVDKIEQILGEKGVELPRQVPNASPLPVPPINGGNGR